MILQYVKQASIRSDVDRMSGAIDDLTKVTNDIIIRYEARDMDEVEKEPWNRLKQNFEMYRIEREKILSTIDGRDEHTSRQVIDDLIGYSQPAYDEIEYIIEMNQELAEEAHLEGHRVYENRSVLMIIVVVVGLGVGLLLAIYLSIYIPSAARKGLEFARALGEGDLTFNIGDVNSDDELGRLIGALREAQQKMRLAVTQITNAQDIIKFINEDVEKDYDLLIDTGERYEKDAVFFDGISQETASMAEELNASTEEIASVIMSIAGNMDDASVNSNEVIIGMKETIMALEQIAAAAESQAEAAGRLGELIHGFKI